jgi:hypothetical protein
MFEKSIVHLYFDFATLPIVVEQQEVSTLCSPLEEELGGHL